MNLISRGTNLIPNSNKKKINIILIIQFFKFLLEMFGIGIIVPIIYFLAKGNEAINQLIDKYELLSIIPERMLSESNLILFILANFSHSLIFSETNDGLSVPDKSTLVFPSFINFFHKSLPSLIE